MKKLLLLPGVLTILLVSCTRDNNTTPGNPITTDSVQLTLIVDSFFTSGTFASVDSNKFSYDDAGRLIEWAAFSASDSSTYGQDFLITRDDQGRAVNIILKHDKNSANGPASPGLITEIHYNSNSNQASFLYQYEESKTPSTGDSLALTYTGENITDTRQFDLSGATPKESFSETVWVFDNAGHLTSSVAEAQDSTSPIYYQYTFDEKVNPLKLGVEALVTDFNKMSFGNILHTNLSWPTGKIFNDDYYVYTYRDDGLPIRCVYTSPSTPTLKRISTYSYSR